MMNVNDFVIVHSAIRTSVKLHRLFLKSTTFLRELSSTNNQNVVHRMTEVVHFVIT